MIYSSLFQRLSVALIWIFMFTVLGFTIAVVNTPGVSWTLGNYWLFLRTSLTNDYFYLHHMNADLILKFFIPTIELVVVSVIIALIISYILITITIHNQTWRNRLFLFFQVMRGIPFIALPLLLSQGFTDHFGNALQQLDQANNSLSYTSLSRLYGIIVARAENPWSVFLNFMGLCLSVSYVVIPITYVLCARVTNQVLKLPYVTRVNESWSALRIMNKMVVHRIVPVFLKEFIFTFANVFMLVCCLEYLFQWRGIGIILIGLVVDKAKYGAELGLALTFVGCFLVIVHFLFILLRELYDPMGIKDLPYELN